MNDKKIRVRFAPSPTGYMHIGNFRTALYGYLFAKKNNGVFILRIEDTDKDRFVKDALEKLIEIMQWAGFDYDEGVYAKSQVESHKPARNASHIEVGGRAGFIFLCLIFHILKNLRFFFILTMPLNFCLG